MEKKVMAVATEMAAGSVAASTVEEVVGLVAAAEANQMP